MLTLLYVFYEVSMATYAGIETVVEEDMARKKRDYTEEEFEALIQERKTKLSACS